MLIAIPREFLQLRCSRLLRSVGRTVAPAAARRQTLSRTVEGEGKRAYRSGEGARRRRGGREPDLPCGTPARRHSPLA